MAWVLVLMMWMGDARSALFGGLDFASSPTAFMATPSVLTRLHRPTLGLVGFLWDHRLWRTGSGLVHGSFAWKPLPGLYAGLIASYGENRETHQWGSALGGALAYRWRRWHVGISVSNVFPPSDSTALPIPRRGGPSVALSVFYQPPEIRYGLFGLGVRRITLWPRTREYWAGLSLDLTQTSSWLPWIVGGFVYRPETTHLTLGVWRPWSLPTPTRFPWALPEITTGVAVRIPSQDFLNPRLSVSLGLRSHRREATDVDLQYTATLPYQTLGLSHWQHHAHLVFYWGDALREKKERERRLQQEQERLQRIQRLEARLQELERQQKRLQYEWEVLEQAREQLQRERQSVEQARRQMLQQKEPSWTLARLDSLPGLEVIQEDSLIRIRATERALRFEPGGTALPVSSLPVLQAIAAYLRAHPEYRVRIVGHTDNVPLGRAWRKKYRDNRGLSLARARSVRDYFVQVEKLPEDRFEIQGKGASEPLAPNTTEAGRARNRRVEILLIPKEPLQERSP